MEILRGSLERLVVALLCLMPVQLHAGANATQALRGMSNAVQDLVQRVSPTVVKILVTGYGPVSDNDRQDAAVIGRQHSIGSGVIVGADGYIVTNAHVVRGAQQVLVVQTPAPAASGDPLAAAKPRILKAKIAGTDKETDLAVLKVEATGLPALPLGDYRQLHQGELVLAFGSPQGLENSVTMGVVSSVLRQVDPDRPMIYIQTDAAINPGNSGGPLVDVDGHLAGINTFILSESGGSEGIGFAIPSVILRFVYQEIRIHGHVHRPEIGARVQTISPALAGGLGLARDWGVIVSDVLPDGPADTAGVKVQDVVVSVAGRLVEGLPMYQAALYQRSHDAPVKLEVLRGSQKLTIDVPVVERQNDFEDVADLVNPDKSLVRPLGILGLEIDKRIAGMLGDLRADSGVLVAARAADSPVETGLAPGDIIHSLNGKPIETLAALRAALDRMRPGDPVALQIERAGRLVYVAFNVE